MSNLHSVSTAALSFKWCSRCDYKRETCILTLEVESWGPRMMSMEADERGLDTAVMWFDSAADTCNLRWAVLALAWLRLLWFKA